MILGQQETKIPCGVQHGKKKKERERERNKEMKKKKRLQEKVGLLEEGH